MSRCGCRPIADRRDHGQPRLAGTAYTHERDSPGARPWGDGRLFHRLPLSREDTTRRGSQSRAGADSEERSDYRDLAAPERSDPLTVRPGRVPGRTRAERAIRRPDRRAVSYTHLRAHETDSYLVCRLLLEK